MKKIYLAILFVILIVVIFFVAKTSDSLKLFYLRHYIGYHYSDKNDSLKRNAANFLLNNIAYKSALTTNGSVITDISLISAEDLITNIDYAFKAWDLPWAKDYSFENFCEFILPYRVYNEPFSPWRKNLYNHLYHILDSTQNKNGQALRKADVVRIVNDFIAFKFTFDESSVRPVMSVNDELMQMNGNCQKRYLLVVSALRSVGIACGLDFTPLGLCWHAGHDWTFYLTDNNDFTPFNGGEIYGKDVSNFPTEKKVPIAPGSATIVYRKYFSINQNDPSITDKNFQAFYDDLTFRNVSNYYVQNKTSLSFKIKKDIKKIYLFGFGIDKNIIPLSVSEVTRDSARFSFLGYPNVYVMGYYSSDTLCIMDYPFFVWGNKGYNFLKPSVDKKVTGKIIRKFPKSWNESIFSGEMLHAEIQLSSDSTFKRATKVYKIKYVPQVVIDTCVKLDLDAYKFIKYKSFSTTGIHLSSFNFYQSDSSSLIKSYFAPNDSSMLNLLDNNIRTNFNTDSLTELTFSLKRITDLNSCFRLELFYRNSFNTIEKGQKYELFFFENGWKHYSFEEASNNWLMLKNMPSNSLWLIRRISKDKEHRIFVLDENGNQSFL